MRWWGHKASDQNTSSVRKQRELAARSQLTVSFSPSSAPLRWHCPRLELVSAPLTSPGQPSETMLEDGRVG